ncbi:MAG: protein kinase domain-containing protein [Acidobacteriota bacterium]
MIRPELDVTQTAPPQPASGDELAPGLRLDHFRIEHKLGAGGMGEVYLATDLALDRPVAIKVLPAQSASGSARERLIREARAQARVQHPNVAHIYFVGEDQGRLYFAMEYIEGKTLADRIAAGPLPVEDALAMIHDAALGLREAQRSGFTHRDVKPSNLMVDRGGGVKVLDFGLVAGSPERAGEGPVQQTTLAGTPLYMAPEQARGEPVDLRADIYALGATLYHLVSGKPPFVADSVDELITLHRSAARPTLPRKGHARTQIAAIDALVERMMATDPDHRFASYDELLLAIENASAAHTRPAGFWVRGCAFLIDVIVVAIVLGIAEKPLPADRELPMSVFGLLMLAAMSIVGIAWTGRTPGMALFELEVVAVDTARRPSWRQAIVRTLVVGGPPIAFLVTTRALEDAEIRLFHGPFTLVAGLISLVMWLLFLHAALRVPGKRAPWDRVAGTMVRYRTGRRSAGG